MYVYIHGPQINLLDTKKHNYNEYIKDTFMRNLNI